MRALFSTTARALWACALVPAAVAAINAAGDGLRLPRTGALLALRAAILWWLAHLMLQRGSRRPGMTPQRHALQFAAAWVVTVLAGVAARPEAAARTRVGWLTAILLAAFVEEVVFRVLLPRRLESDLSRRVGTRPAVTMAVAASQIVFAACHLLPTSERPTEAIHALALVAAGVSLWAIVQRVGLWLGASLHALVNVSLTLTPTAVASAITPMLVTLWIVGGVCLATLALPRRAAAGIAGGWFPDLSWGDRPTLRRRHVR